MKMVFGKKYQFKKLFFPLCERPQKIPLLHPTLLTRTDALRYAYGRARDGAGAGDVVSGTYGSDLLSFCNPDGTCSGDVVIEEWCFDSIKYWWERKSGGK